MKNNSEMSFIVEAEIFSGKEGFKEYCALYDIHLLIKLFHFPKAYKNIHCCHPVNLEFNLFLL